MKQILISKNPQIKALAGSQIEFSSEELLFLKSSQVEKIMIPFKAKIMAGGKLDLDFALPESLASRGVGLLGAYWDGSTVSIYLRGIDGAQIGIDAGTTILVGTLVQVATFRQVEDGLLEGVVNVDASGKVLAIEKPKKKASRRRKQ